jgi:hypothetical protein
MSDAADTPRFESFEEFWPFYVKQHARKATRVLHFVGTTGAMACVAGAALLRRPSLLLLAPVVGYGPAWASHYFLEKNRPATFTYPAWSLRADLVMWTKMVRGEMDSEVARILAEDELASSAEPPPPDPAAPAGAEVGPVSTSHASADRAIN